MKYGLITPLETAPYLYFEIYNEITVDKMDFGSIRSGYFPNTVQDWYPLVALELFKNK
jgi:hypothetical protein